MTKQFFLLVLMALGLAVTSQTTTPSDFDKKYRFGLRLAMQPTWFSTTDKKITPKGASFGWGFGLNMEYRFSEVAGLLTGIGGDFEAARYTYSYDATNNYVVAYFMDENDEFVSPSNDAINKMKKNNYKAFILKERKVRANYATIPFILKLSTREYNNMKYFGMFGLELGFRVKATANDEYYGAYKYINDSTSTVLPISDQSALDISKDASLVPLRIGLNAGAGVEYRVATSTSLFANINFFRSFTNFGQTKSEYLFYNWNEIDKAKGSEKVTYSFIKQNLIFNAIRINFGVMF